MLQSRGQWPQVHHLPHWITCLPPPAPSLPVSSIPFSSLLPFLYSSFLLVSAFYQSLWISLLCFFSLLSSCFTPFSLLWSPLLLYHFLSLSSFLSSTSLFFSSLLLCSSPLNISSSCYLSSPLSSYFFLFPSHLFFLLLSTQLLYSSPHFFSFFLFPLLVNYALIYPPLSSSFRSSFLPLCFFILLSSVFI